MVNGEVSVYSTHTLSVETDTMRLLKNDNGWFFTVKSDNPTYDVSSTTKFFNENALTKVLLDAKVAYEKIKEKEKTFNVL